MFSQICRCGCGDEPEKAPNGTYLPFTKGHDNGVVAAAYREWKNKAFEQSRAETAARNRAVAAASEAARHRKK